MGNGPSSVYLSTTFEGWLHPEFRPSILEQPKSDPNLGFENERKERVSTLTEEEMRLAKIPAAKRDYCADRFLKLEICRRSNFPLFYRCEHELHDFSACQYDDQILRMKEFERERRLVKRGILKRPQEETIQTDNA